MVGRPGPMMTGGTPLSAIAPEILFVFPGPDPAGAVNAVGRFSLNVNPLIESPFSGVKLGTSEKVTCGGCSVPRWTANGAAIAPQTGSRTAQTIAVR